MLLEHINFFKFHLFYIAKAVCEIILHLFTMLILLASYMGYILILVLLENSEFIVNSCGITTRKYNSKYVL